MSVNQEIIWTTSKSKDDFVVDAKVEMAIEQLTKSGIGKIVANGLVDAIITEAKAAIREGPLSAHPSATEHLIAQVEASMRERCQSTIEQIENAIKPLKYDLEYDSGNWNDSKNRLFEMFRKVEHRWSDELKDIKKEVGKSRLRKLVQMLSENEDNAILETIASPMVIERVKKIVLLTQNLKRIKDRKDALSCKECHEIKFEENKKGWQHWIPFYSVRKEDSDSFDDLWELQKSHRRKCPEIFLYLVMEKLLGTATLHAHHELVYEFLNPFPDELATSFPMKSVGGFCKSEIMKFIEENPHVYRHYQLQERKRVLEKVKEDLQVLQYFSKSHSS